LFSAQYKNKGKIPQHIDSTGGVSQEGTSSGALIFLVGVRGLEPRTSTMST